MLSQVTPGYDILGHVMTVWAKII